MSWSAGQYVKFEDERTRPVRDLVGAIPVTAARRAVDLGCGPGNSTEVLAARLPEATITGLDSSEDMLREARRRLPDIRFERADIAAWDERGQWDVMLANAVLQWLPDHAGLLPRLASRLAAGGSLAVQMPDNVEEPSHVLMRQLAQDARWSGKLRPALEQRGLLPPPRWYYALLRPECRRVDVWRTTYHHPLPGLDGVVEWFKGSALRPFLEPLKEDERAEYLRRYRESLASAYPVEADGTVLLPFPRLFIVATR